MHIVPSLTFFLSVSSFLFSLFPVSPPLLPLLFPLSCLQGNLSQTSVVLEGQVERGRFGTSVVNLGDIDDDSREGM